MGLWDSRRIAIVAYAGKPLVQFAQTGFCGPGKGGAFVLAHELNRNGELPLNTGGGPISAGQPGLAGGGVNLVECSRQPFGEAGPRQVRRHENTIGQAVGVDRAHPDTAATFPVFKPAG